MQITIDGAFDPNWRQRKKDEKEIEDYLALKKDALQERTRALFTLLAAAASPALPLHSRSSSGQLPLAPLIGPPPTPAKRNQRQWGTVGARERVEGSET